MSRCYPYTRPGHEKKAQAQDLLFVKGPNEDRKKDKEGKKRDKRKKHKEDEGTKKSNKRQKSLLNIYSQPDKKPGESVAGTLEQGPVNAHNTSSTSAPARHILQPSPTRLYNTEVLAKGEPNGREHLPQNFVKISAPASIVPSHAEPKEGMEVRVTSVREANGSAVLEKVEVKEIAVGREVDSDGLDWLFPSRKQKEAGMTSWEDVKATIPQAWAEPVHLAAVDRTALPYVIRF